MTNFLYFCDDLKKKSPVLGSITLRSYFNFFFKKEPFMSRTFHCVFSASRKDSPESNQAINFNAIQSEHNDNITYFLFMNYFICRFKKYIITYIKA